MRRLNLATIIICALWIWPSPGLSAEACVTCAGPDRTYRCQIEGAADTRGASFFCVTRLAQDFGHDACAVSKTAACEGVLQIYHAEEAGAEAPLVQPEPGPQSAAASAPQDAPASAPDEDRAKEKSGVAKAGESVGKAFKQTGKAVGEAAKKTWDCLGSALRNC